MQLEQHDRDKMLALLNGNAQALRKIEFAIGQYLEMLPIARQAKQEPREIKNDADELHQALQSLVRIMADDGEAWTNFKAGAAADGQASALHNLIEALGPGAGEPGEALAFAAAQTADDLKPSRKRPRSAEKSTRFVLMFHVANTAQEAGVLVSRNSTAFREIIETAYEAAGISNRTHGREFGLYNAENDLKEYLKAFAE